MKSLLVLRMLIALAGCRTEPVGKTIEDMTPVEVEAASQALMAACRARGVDMGSRDFDDCVRQEAIRRGYTR